MVVIIGHGPSIVGKKLGRWIDQQTVVRLKHCLKANAEDWGSKTDYRCASADGWPNDVPTWVLPSAHKVAHLFASHDHVRVSDGRWYPYFQSFSPAYKMSTGLRAIFCAAEFLEPKEIGLIGFDNLIRPYVLGFTKWFHERGKYQRLHDYVAEHKAAYDLGIKLIDLGETNVGTL